ncbi:MAG: flagellar basal-body rod protein FlgF [Nitrospinae bacterium CG11_big_fil_rev_8_21_14_0_20_45_15]|nr:MAG: flagellar basal-body rod protein FlgF [Nitrospinae bacterium CG11_big_fil_rev_8_21_14_0_20_45_15]
MQEGIYIAASAGLKQQSKLDIIANNLANLNNTGFKRDGVVFKEMIAPFQKNGGFEEARNALLPPDQSNTNVAYVGINDFYTDHKQGGVLETGNTLDLALEGDGFFQIGTSAGTRYSRKGNFRLDTQNRLVTQEGDPVLGKNGAPVVINAVGGDISIAADGIVSVGKGLNNANLGQINVVRFENRDQLVKEGSGLYKKGSPDLQEEAKTTSVLQGYLETSNVNTMEEMTDMITTMRGFEAYQKVIQSIDDINGQSVNTIGRVG